MWEYGGKRESEVLSMITCCGWRKHETTRDLLLDHRYEMSRSFNKADGIRDLPRLSHFGI